MNSVDSGERSISRRSCRKKRISHDNASDANFWILLGFPSDPVNAPVEAATTVVIVDIVPATVEATYPVS